MSRESWASIAGELDGTTGVDRLEEELAESRDRLAVQDDEITRLRERLADSWYVDIGERLDAALTEVTRLRQGIEAHLAAQTTAPCLDDVDAELWALLTPRCPSCGDNGDCGETAAECGNEFHGDGRH